MKAVSGVYRKGKVVLDRQVDWAEGSRVTILPPQEVIGLREADWPDSPETRAAILARMAAVQPLILTPQDEAEIAAAREAVRQVTIEAVKKQMGLP